MGLNWFTLAVGASGVLVSGLVGAVISRRVMHAYVLGHKNAVAPNGNVRGSNPGGGGGGEDPERGEDGSARSARRSSAGGSWTAGWFGAGRVSGLTPRGGGEPQTGQRATLTAAAMAAKDERDAHNLSEALLARRSAAAGWDEDRFLWEWWWEESEWGPPTPEEPPPVVFPNSFEREIEALERRHFAQMMCDQHQFLVSRMPTAASRSAVASGASTVHARHRRNASRVGHGGREEGTL